jgi:hypothetical protein
MNNTVQSNPNNTYHLTAMFFELKRGMGIPKSNAQKSEGESPSTMMRLLREQFDESTAVNLTAPGR